MGDLVIPPPPVVIPLPSIATASTVPPVVTPSPWGTQPDRFGVWVGEVPAIDDSRPPLLACSVAVGDLHVDKLFGVHLGLQARIRRILMAMAAAGFAMRVVYGVRTDAEQQALYQQGRALPGKIVTMKDGIHTRSNHQTHSDGYSWAVDCCFLDDPQLPGTEEMWSANRPWALYGALGESLGLVWGGRWHAPVDLAHLEVPAGGLR
jgi:peptidoglycan L-alanyl-D-glutamate endopeptidase CwlK